MCAAGTVQCSSSNPLTGTQFVQICPCYPLVRESIKGICKTLAAKTRNCVLSGMPLIKERVHCTCTHVYQPIVFLVIVPWNIKLVVLARDFTWVKICIQSGFISEQDGKAPVSCFILPHTGSLSHSDFVLPPTGNVLARVHVTSYCHPTGNVLATVALYCHLLAVLATVTLYYHLLAMF